MAYSGEVGAVILDLSNEYERSRKFLADLCHSLEAHGVLKRQDDSSKLEDSRVAAKELDGAAPSSVQDMELINPFATYELSRQDSGLSHCSEASSSNPHVPDLDPDSRSPHTNLSTEGCGNNSNDNSSRSVPHRGDMTPIPTASSPLRSQRTSRVVRRPSGVSSSCPCVRSSQEERAPGSPGHDQHQHGSAIHSVSALDRRISGLGTASGPGPGGCIPSSPLEPSASTPLSQLLQVRPPQPSPPRRRRSSLDFIPLPPAHHRVHLSFLTLGPQQQQQPGSLGPAPPAGPPPEGHKHHPLLKRGPLEVYGGPPVVGPTPYGHPSCSDVAPSGAPSGACRVSSSGGVSSGCGGVSRVSGGGGILSRSSFPLNCRGFLTVHSQPPPPSPLSGQRSHSPSHSQPLELLALQNHPLQYNATANAAVSRTPAALALEALGRSEAGFAGAHPPTVMLPAAGSPQGSGGDVSHLPALLPCPSGGLLPPTPAPTPPGARSSSDGAAAAAAAVLSGGSEHGGVGCSSPMPSPPVIVQKLSFSGLHPSTTATAAVASSSQDGSPIRHSEWRPRSGRFSRCSLGPQQMAAATAGPAATATPAAAAASSLLGQHQLHNHHPLYYAPPWGGSSGRDRRVFSSGELPEERLAHRTSFLLPSSSSLGGGTGSAGGSPLTARSLGSVQSADWMLARGESSGFVGGSGGGGEAAVGSFALRTASSPQQEPHRPQASQHNQQLLQAHQHLMQHHMQQQQQQLLHSRQHQQQQPQPQQQLTLQAVLTGLRPDTRARLAAPGGSQR